jgi:hypothetical protein
VESPGWTAQQQAEDFLGRTTAFRAWREQRDQRGGGDGAGVEQSTGAGGVYAVVEQSRQVGHGGHLSGRVSVPVVLVRPVSSDIAGRYGADVASSLMFPILFRSGVLRGGRRVDR